MELEEEEGMTHKRNWIEESLLHNRELFLYHNGHSLDLKVKILVQVCPITHFPPVGVFWSRIDIRGTWSC